MMIVYFFLELGSKISSFFTGSSDTDGSKEESKDQETKVNGFFIQT